MIKKSNYMKPANIIFSNKEKEDFNMKTNENIDILLSDEEIARICDIAKHESDSKSKVAPLALIIMSETGLRLTEVLNLKWGDVFAVINHAPIPDNSNLVRTISLAYAINFLSDIPTTYNDYIFQYRSRNNIIVKISPENIFRLFRIYVLKAGIAPNKCIHSIRYLYQKKYNLPLDPK